MNHSLVKWAVLAGAATAAVSAQAAGLSVRLDVASPVLKGDVDVHVTLTLTNTSRTPMFLPKTQLPGEVHEAALFRITRDGEPVAYQGRLVKRTAAAERDVVRLAPGASMSFQVELTGGYDLSENGRYAIEYVGLAKQQSGQTALLAADAAAPTYLWLEGRTPQPQAQAALAPSLAASISYTGNCTATQKSTLASAVTAATNYSQSSYNYLSATPSATTRYKTWFGAFSTTGWNTAKSHYSKALDAFKNKPLTLDCSCKDSGTYAYVYPNQPYKIYVCGAFWSAPMTGTDSKGGTLVHEMTHFTVVAGTDDWAYGQSAAKSLALSNPTKALDNADSHEYFAENNPVQP